MRFAVTTLGTGAALPARGRYPSAQLLNVRERLFLIDCGEGTQERLRMAQVNMGRIARIFISHMHGDHYLGLMGLISSMHLLGRTMALNIHGPLELREVIELQLRISKTYLRFPLRFHAVAHRSGQPVYSDERVEVTELALLHRIECTGYLFRETLRMRHLRKETVEPDPALCTESGEDGRGPAAPRRPRDPQRRTDGAALAAAQLRLLLGHSLCA
ncbi:MAG: MBL fold metallo-hydrolase [Flavobacteriales bacterium]|nr:MBL fold metallo-hydrolase [Flavobacteriales bacterium]